MTLTLVGPSGYFVMRNTAQNNAPSGVNLGPNFVTGALPQFAGSFSSFPPSSENTGIQINNIDEGIFRYNPSTRGGTVCCSALAVIGSGVFNITLNHTFTLGNEARTFVPEPNTATLLKNK